ncbi:hypothetical protein [Mucilaginibacter segetis]|uniref:Uncharacterized protein n=1 Tax=Mucilaginibacter segetis TaxID=2793071 RepID=A0A934PSM2_9SPHI|nr:hypothetical protein [Mucilaginibacter segetis]MBK0378872.1 hypothetical protein [Mucilaginibacter segetis]
MNRNFLMIIFLCLLSGNALSQITAGFVNSMQDKGSSTPLYPPQGISQEQ